MRKARLAGRSSGLVCTIGGGSCPPTRTAGAASARGTRGPHFDEPTRRQRWLRGELAAAHLRGHTANAAAMANFDTGESIGDGWGSALSGVRH
jgi:hypothetical protein